MTGKVFDEVDGVSRTLQLQAADLSTVVINDVVSCLKTLDAVSCERLTVENNGEQEEIGKALTRVLEWLHQEMAMPVMYTTTTSDHVCEKDDMCIKVSVQKQMSQVFSRWHDVQQKTRPLNWRLWLLWLELGCTLDVLNCCNVVEKKNKSFALLMTTSCPPRDFPTSATICNKEKHAVFCRELWDAVMFKPLNGAPSRFQWEAAPMLVEVFVHWMRAAMRGYELAFIANVALPLQNHLHAASTLKDSLLRDTWLNCARRTSGGASTLTDAGSLAVTTIVLSALTLAHRTPEVAQYLESLRTEIMDELLSRPFSHPRSSVAIVAMALGLTILNDARCSSDVSIQSQSGNATILSQFALLRLVNLSLVEPRLKSDTDTTIFEYQRKVHQWVKALTLEPSHAILQEHSLQMTELCIEEVVSFFVTSFDTYLCLIEAMQSILPTNLFRPTILKVHKMSRSSVVQDNSPLISAREIVTFIRQFYECVAPILEVLAVGDIVRSFVALSQIEFAREICVSLSANASMQAVTQQLEQSLEKTKSPPEHIFAPILHSTAMHSVTMNSKILPEMDIISGCQALAVGCVVQRKLRILLFQCAPLIDDALSVVFLVLYNIFEPADTFGHGFLGMCLSHLAQLIPRSVILPHYLQVTLASYPANASPQALTKAYGVIFGSLFYSRTFVVPTTLEANGTEESTRLTVLWAIRKCCERSTELLVEEEKMTVTEEFAKESIASIETGGLYLVGLVFDLMKIAPVNILANISMEAERLLAHWKNNPRVLRELKSALFARISQNCEAKTRAWFAVWYIEVDRLYPVEPPLSTHTVLSRL